MPNKYFNWPPEIIEKYRLAQIGKKRHGAKGWIAHGRRFVMHKGKEMLEHRVIMELYIGRSLEKDEVVHHINENPLDNRIENLQLMKKGEHSSHHDVGKKRAGQLTEAGRAKKSECTKRRWENGEFANRPPRTKETKQKVSEAMKKIRANKFWS
jgi:hypothetical protein